MKINKLSRTQKYWLRKLVASGRLQMGGTAQGHIPERTAKVLIDWGLAYTEWQALLTRRPWPRDLFVLPILTEGGATSNPTERQPQ